MSVFCLVIEGMQRVKWCLLDTLVLLVRRGGLVCGSQVLIFVQLVSGITSFYHWLIALVQGAPLCSMIVWKVHGVIMSWVEFASIVSLIRVVQWSLLQSLALLARRGLEWRGQFLITWVGVSLPSGWDGILRATGERALPLPLMYWARMESSDLEGSQAQEGARWMSRGWAEIQFTIRGRQHWGRWWNIQKGRLESIQWWRGSRTVANRAPGTGLGENGAGQQATRRRGSDLWWRGVR